MELGKLIGRTLGPIYTKERNNKHGDATFRVPTPKISPDEFLVIHLRLRGKKEPTSFRIKDMYIDSCNPQRVSYIFNCPDNRNPINGRLLRKHPYIRVPLNRVTGITYSSQFE